MKEGQTRKHSETLDKLSNLWQDPDLSVLERSALGVFIRFCEDSGSGGVSSKALAEELGCSRKQAKMLRLQIARKAGLRRGF